VQGWQPGMYVVKVVLGNEVYTDKMILTK
jgi:hypothetical protein